MLLFVAVNALLLGGCLAAAVIGAALGVHLVLLVVRPDEEVAESIGVLLQPVAVLEQDEVLILWLMGFSFLRLHRRLLLLGPIVIVPLFLHVF